jgi:transposase InsO family protein
MDTVDMFEMMIKRIKVYIFIAVDKISRILYMRAYKNKSSKNSADFLRRLNYVHNKKIRYIQVDNGREFEGEFEKMITELGIVKITNYVRSPKMNAYVEKGIDTVQLEYGYKIEEAEDVEDVNKVLYECMLYYNFYRPHKSLQYHSIKDST